jgi:hypothetical protein
MLMIASPAVQIASQASAPRGKATRKSSGWRDPFSRPPGIRAKSTLFAFRDRFKLDSLGLRGYRKARWFAG